jgi:NADPH-dependent 2,4-dienoyl-CoA reductase/sulfur reductase-like enzyme
VATVAQRDLEHLRRVVVVGASLAGLRACETLRTDGFTGTIVLVGDEEHLPYDRPPLSKKLLAGEWEPDRIVLRKPEAVDELGLELRLGVRATGLDLDGRSVHLADGSPVPFDGLVLATGSRTRRLPGQDAVPEVRELRTLDDSLALRELIAGGTARVVVVGAGFIGLEVAATAHSLGCSVTVLEAAEAPLIRGLGAEMGRATTSIHDGFTIRCGVAVERLHTDGVGLAGGEWLPADVVVVGIGVAPATEWLEGSGLELRDGVVCDATLCAGVAGVYAAGDLARWPNELYGDEMRLEHWTNAAEQGAAAAHNLLAIAAGGAAEAYAPVPFFWSDQAPHRIQLLGHCGGADDDVEVEVVVGSPADRRFLALYGRRGRLLGALGVNAPRLVMPYRPLLAAAATWNDAHALAGEQRRAQQT